MGFVTVLSFIRSPDCPVDVVTLAGSPVPQFIG